MSNDSGMAQDLISSMEPLLPTAVKTLASFLDAEDNSRASRDKAKLALQIVNTSITLQRAKWTQDRHLTSVARTLSDGDLDIFQNYIKSAMPSFPMVREAVLPEKTS